MTMGVHPFVEHQIMLRSFMLSPVNNLKMTEDEYMQKSPGGLLMRLGQPFSKAYRPPGVRKMKRHHCFQNALRLAERENFLYVEGSVNVHGLWIEHAWCYDIDGGRSIDPTLETPHIWEYWFGIALWPGDAMNIFCRLGFYGIFPNLYCDRTGELPAMLEARRVQIKSDEYADA